MNFEMLKDAITLNANEPPTIINALCMMHTVYKNVEAESGLLLSQCPIGDGQLQRELIQISKKLLSIYNDNSDALQRNRARLDTIMKDLHDAQTELLKIEESTGSIPEKEAEYRQLAGHLEAAKAAQSTYAELLGKIELAKKELAALERFDFDSALQQLADLQQQICGLEDQIRDLDKDIQEKKNQKEKLENQIVSDRSETEQLMAQMEQLTCQHNDLLSQLQDAHDKRTAQQTAIEAARAEQDRLEKLIAESGKLLQELEAQIDSLTCEKETLDGDVAAMRELLSELGSDVANLRQELTQMLQPEQRRLTELKQALEDEKRCTMQQIAELTQETNALNAELAQIRRELPLRMQERDAARQRVEDYRRDMLDPVVAELHELLATEEQLQADNAAVEQQISELTENQQKLVMEISRRKEQYHLDNTDYQNKLEREKKLISDQEELTRKLQQTTEDLALRQDEYYELHDKTLPAAEKYLADETKRRDELQMQIDAINSQCQENAQLIAGRELEIPVLQENLRKLRSRYDALTITFTTNNLDILEMERQIRELEAKNDKERLNEYRTQLQSKQKELEDLAQNCEKLDVQIQTLDKNLKTKNEDCRTLEDLKRKKEDGMRGIEEMLAELRPCSAPEYRRRAEAIDARFHTLLAVRNNLANSILFARKTITGYEPASNEAYILKLEEYLSQASACALDVHQQLISCANALKNHIMEEPK